MIENLETKFITRQYMISRNFEVFYYRDASLPPEVQPHFHDFFEFFFFISGDVTMQAADQAYSLHAGDLVVIPPGAVHCRTIESMQRPYCRIVLWVSAQFLQLLEDKGGSDFLYLIQSAPNGQPFLMHLEPISFYAIQAQLFHLIEEQRSQRFGSGQLCSLHLAQLLLNLSRLLYEQKSDRTPPALLHQKLIVYIGQHLQDDLSLETLSLKFYVSKFHIAHIFKENYGISIHQYITRKRLAVCRNVIESGGQISLIYRQYGFRDYSAFYRAFKKEYGISPRECQELTAVKPRSSLP